MTLPINRNDLPSIVELPARIQKLPFEYLNTFKTGDTTPSVIDGRVFVSPPGATTITDFDDGADNQSIAILGNGNLTVTNNANIKTNTAANKVLANNKVYRFTLINSVWYEDA